MDIVRRRRVGFYLVIIPCSEGAAVHPAQGNALRNEGHLKGFPVQRTTRSPVYFGELLARWADTVRIDLAPQGVALG